MIFLNQILFHCYSICAIENFGIKLFLIISTQLSYWSTISAHDDFGFINCPHLRTAIYIPSEDLYIFASGTGFQKIPWPKGPKKDFFMYPDKHTDTNYLIYLHDKKGFDNGLWKMELKNKSTLIEPFIKSDTEDDCFISAMSRGSNSPDDIFLYVRSKDHELNSFDRIIHLSEEKRKLDQFRCTGPPDGLLIDLDQIPNRPSLTDGLFSALGIFGLASAKKEDKLKYSRKLYLAAVSEKFPLFIFQAKTSGHEIGVGVLKEESGGMSVYAVRVGPTDILFSSYAFCSPAGKFLYGFGYRDGNNVVLKVAIDKFESSIQPWNMSDDDDKLTLIDAEIVLRKEDPNYEYRLPYIIRYKDEKLPKDTYAIVLMPKHDTHVAIFYDFKTSLSRATVAMRCDHTLTTAFCKIRVPEQMEYMFITPHDWSLYPMLSEGPNGTEFSQNRLFLESCIITVNPKHCEQLVSLHGDQCHFVGGMCMADRERIKHKAYIVRDAQFIHIYAGITLPLMVFFIAILITLFSLIDWMARQQLGIEYEEQSDSRRSSRSIQG